MRVVVAGATGRIGSRTVARLRDHGVEVAPLSRAEGVDLITGEGLAEALRGADVVVDVADTPSRGEIASLDGGFSLRCAVSGGICFVRGVVPERCPQQRQGGTAPPCSLDNQGYVSGLASHALLSRRPQPKYRQ